MVISVHSNEQDKASLIFVYRPDDIMRGEATNYAVPLYAHSSTHCYFMH